MADIYFGPPKNMPAAPPGAQGDPNGQPGADPFAAFPDSPPVAPTQQGKPGAQAGADPFADFPDTPPKQSEKAPARQQSGGEAAARGIVDTATFGLAPAITGLANASGIPSAAKNDEEIDVNPIRPILGGAKLLHEWLSDHPDPAVRAAYDKGRQDALDVQNQAEEQHPHAYMAGQFAGALATLPIGGGELAAGKMAPGVVSRIATGAKVGAVQNAAQSGGASISEGNDPTKVAVDTVKGGATGALFGTGGATALEGVKAGGGIVRNVVRGQQNPEAQAAARAADPLISDRAKYGARFTPEETQAAKEAGTPIALADFGGERTRAVARSAANTSPEARQALEDFTSARLQNQAPRIGNYIRDLTGGAEASTDKLAIKAAGRKANAPLYRKFHAESRGGHWSEEMANLVQAPEVQNAIRVAQVNAKNWAVKEGNAPPVGAFVIEKGKTKLRKTADGKGQYIPSGQLWDYVKRALDEQATPTAKSFSRAIRDELDAKFPSYAKARSSAASFFGAENAEEAGQKFVMSGSDIPGARRAIALMSPTEKELFARGFASDLADRIMRSGDNTNVLNSIFLNKRAMEKIEMALGQSRARRLEALLRVEKKVDELRKSLGNSSTARQLVEHGMAGGVGAGAVGAYEFMKEEGVSPAHVIAAGLAGAFLRQGAQRIDARVARHVGELLASDKPAALRQGVEIVTKNPVIFKMLRAMTSAGGRVGAHDVGPERTAAGVAAGLQTLVREGDPIAHHGEDILDQATQ